MTVSIGPGWSIGAGWTMGPGNFAGQTTIAVQNVAGTGGVVGFFFLGSWANDTHVPSFNDIQPGWLVVQIPGATVVSTDPPTQTITITGGVFASGVSYSFQGV